MSNQETQEKALSPLALGDRPDANIYQRLALVRKGVEYIQKDKAVQGYMAVTHDMVTAHVRDYLDKYGVLTLQSLQKSTTVDTGMVTQKGAPIIRYEATYEIGFVNVDRPEERVIVLTEAHANDTGDKAPGKAMSYAMKYAFLKTLNIETGEADEARVVGEPPVLSDAQKLELLGILTESGIEAKEAKDIMTLMAVKAFGVERADDIRADQFEHARTLLDIKVKKMREESDKEAAKAQVATGAMNAAAGDK